MVKKIIGVVIFTIIGVGLYHKNFIYNQLSVLWGDHTASAPCTIITVSIQRVHNESEPFKHLSTFIEKRYNESNQQIFNLESELRQEYKALRADEKLAHDEHDNLIKRKEDFDRRVSEIEDMVMRKKSDLNNIYLSEKEKIEALLKNIIENLAREYHASLVLNTTLGDDASIVLFKVDTLDITDRVITELNTGATQLDLLKD